MTHSTAYNEGYSDRVAGIPQSENPYANEWRGSWFEGWLDAANKRVNKMDKNTIAINSAVENLNFQSILLISVLKDKSASEYEVKRIHRAFRNAQQHAISLCSR